MIKHRPISLSFLHIFLHIQPNTQMSPAEVSQGENKFAHGFPHPHQIPKIQGAEKRKWMLQHMAGAFRIFGRKGYTEGSAGHISIRDPIDPNTFWINPIGVHYNLMKPSHMVHVDEAGNILKDGNQAAVNTAGFLIHSAIHKARPDVDAACHTHSIHGKAYSAFGKELEMINQDVCTFFKAHSVYSAFGGVVLGDEEGRKIAEALGDNMGVILQNHGLLTVGRTVDEAAYLFTLMERSCEAQMLANAAESQGFTKNIIHDEEAQFTFDSSCDMVTLYAEMQPDYEYELHLDDFREQ